MSERRSIYAENTFDAAREILYQVEYGYKHANVFYFDGWDGIGASAALKEAAKRLKSSASKFDSVLHLDCSLWKSRRALQKAIAEEIKLPHSVMAILSQHDKEDDFNGVEEGARNEVREIIKHTYTKLATVKRLVVVFHNGSGSFIDLSEFGIPLNRNFKGDVLLWTMQGRFRPYVSYTIKEKDPNMVYLYVDPDTVQLDDTSLWGIVNEEAKEVAQYTGTIDHMAVVACILYTWKLKDMGNIDWDTHASNYWVCDGIIQGSSSSEAWDWKVGDALQRNMHLGWISRSYMDYFFSSSAIEMQMQHYLPRPPAICCTSEIISVPAEATSFFLQPKYGDEESQLLASMFKHSASNLRVLHLSGCTFRFASPPFLCCSNLRFLLLHRCKDDGTSITPTEGKELDDQSGAWRACFGKLQVMDLSYTKWWWLLSQRMNIMANLRELNAKGIKNLSTSHLRGCGRLVKLRVEDGSVDGQRLILENSVALELAVLVNHAKDEGATYISFRGCAQLRSILLGGLFCCLHELDLSCTSVETVDLREVEAQRLKRLILLGCQKLRAILWPPRSSSILETLDVFCVSTTPSTASGQEWPHLCKWEEKRKEATSASTAESSSLDRNWYICVRDARLLRSLDVFYTYENNRCSIGWPARVEFTTPPASGDLVAAQGVNILQQSIHVVDVYARDMITHNQLIHDEDATAGDEDGEGAIHWMWDCPTTRTMHGHGLYIHVQAEDDEQEGELNIGGTWSMPPRFICTSADVMHVHDCLSITSGISLSYITSWDLLNWCRVERCPMLRSVFTAFSEGKENDISSDSWLIFQNLTTFWASHLPMAKHIWNWSPRAYPSAYSFQQLQFLHLDYCPRVIFVLPLDSNMSLPQLETLEIICCGDLREIFRPQDPRLENQEEVVKHFPKLRRIHLHNLPTLRGICGRMMSSPMLETINVTGCPALRRLPAVGGRLAQPPTVVCEKDWWDGLEWDGLEAKHHPSLFRPKHSCHYRKPKLLRGSVLR